MKKIRVIIIKDGVKHEIEFVGKYRRDLEAENWHYYEKSDGELLHCRKSCMVCVEDSPCDIFKPKCPIM
jgi:hypothetical protein